VSLRTRDLELTAARPPVGGDPKVVSADLPEFVARHGLKSWSPVRIGRPARPLIDQVWRDAASE
jgi:hypothetical protein